MQKAKLSLDDGTSLSGFSFGFNRSTVGEVVFNTGMVGYPETLTDPSYKGQILVFTYPLIGNYGVPKNTQKNGISDFFESSKIHLSGIVVSDYSFQFSHWNAVKSLSDWLKEESVPGIFGVDTRLLTKRLRDKGTMPGKIIIKNDPSSFIPGQVNVVSQVSIDKPIIYPGRGKTILLIDCGVKYNIIRSLLCRGFSVIRVPWDYDIHNGKFEYDAIVLSNGPGDPKVCTPTINNIKIAIEKDIPIFGICLGNQILALASGANTYKLPYGHRSQNQPCILVNTKRCFITSQNHGYAVDSKTLPPGWQEFFINANDSTNEGIRHRIKPWMSVQFHPEACPGPVDTGFLFDRFKEMIL